MTARARSIGFGWSTLIVAEHWRSHFSGMRKAEIKADFVLAVLSGLLYLSLRLALHCAIVAAGYRDGGLISYDSYYPLAFAQELAREESLLLFQNPFGTLDSVPRLFNLYATFLLFFHPLHSASLFTFDLAAGTLFVSLTSYCLCRLLTPTGSLEKIFILFGGGVAFIGVSLGKVPAQEAVSAGYWGLTYLLNQVASPEIIYHFIFFIGLIALVKRKDLWVISALALLTFLHPFTAITFAASVFSAWFYSLTRTKRFRNDRGRLTVYAFSSVVISILLFEIFLPSVSRDANFFRNAYRAARFYIDIEKYLLFLGLPGIYCLLSWITAGKPRYHQGDSEKLWIFAGTALFCILMTTSYLYTNKVVQPAHWSRAYAYVLLLGISALFTKKPGASPREKRLVLSIKVLFLGLGLLDSGLGVAYTGNALLAERRPPFILTGDQAEIIEKLRGLPSGRIVYLRDSGNRDFFGDLEYAIMSLSPQKAFFGHTFFSPFLETLRHDSYLSRTTPDLPLRLLRLSDYIVFDTILYHYHSPTMAWKILFEGQELVLVKNMERTETVAIPFW